MTTLKKLLSLPRFSDLTLLTCKIDELNQPVDSIEVTETPDVEHYIPANVFLLTTAMSFKDNQRDLIPFIDSLKRANVACLAIKTNRFLGEIDSEVLDYARSVDFPIVSIPGRYPLGSLLHQLLNIIWGTNQEETSFALDIQRKFSDLLIQGAENPVIIDEFSRIIKSPILLLNPFKEVITNSKQFNNINHPVESYVEQVKDVISHSGGQEGLFTVSHPSGEKVKILLKDLYVHNYYPHYLVIFSPERLPFPNSTLTIEQAGLVLTFNLFKNVKLVESRLSIEADFFREVKQVKHQIDMTNGDDKELVNKFGYKLSNFYQIISVFEKGTLESSHYSKKQEDMIKLISIWLRDHIQEYFKDAIAVHSQSKNEILIILQRDPNNLEEQLIVLHDYFYKTLAIELIFSVGNSYDSIEDINRSYTQSQLNLQDIDAHSPNTVTFFKDQGLYHLFNNLDNNQVYNFCRSILKDLAFPTENNLVDLRQTLAVYLDCQCEITKTAEILYIHRNTVSYRIKRCEEILKMKIDTPENSLNLRLALALSKYE